MTQYCFLRIPYYHNITCPVYYTINPAYSQVSTNTNYPERLVRRNVYNLVHTWYIICWHHSTWCMIWISMIYHMHSNGSLLNHMVTLIWLYDGGCVDVWLTSCLVLHCFIYNIWKHCSIVHITHPMWRVGVIIPSPILSQFSSRHIFTVPDHDVCNLCLALI